MSGNSGFMLILIALLPARVLAPAVRDKYTSMLIEYRVPGRAEGLVLLLPTSSAKLSTLPLV